MPCKHTWTSTLHARILAMHATRFTKPWVGVAQCLYVRRLMRSVVDNENVMDDPKHNGPSQPELAASSRGLVHQHVFETAVHRTRMAMTLSDPNLPDCPLVYVNPAFTKLTGYDPASCLGLNCRFLQGPETDRDVVQRIRQATAEHRSIDEEIYNYRRDGSGF